ncbi:DNA/RNA polymerase [Ascobolus immersus RN42]|uniref:DNA/RNA polymerase n=1 Tax=Ascobolus immersus RN42 TaxID=1160509 RepID=A0A3N4IPW9_ASCIM|nr:DNA/RNA polymerase [Ascobolus immersus RN42]
MTDKRGKERIIIHIDYDCFYASVWENLRPELRTVPLGIQQKSILATCNYIARERGVKKLQLIKDAKAACPDLVIVNGEDLTPFRDASRSIFNFIAGTLVGTNQMERLGFDEIFIDVTALVDHNLALLLNSAPGDTFSFHLTLSPPHTTFPINLHNLPPYTHPSDSIPPSFSSLSLDTSGQAQPPETIRLLQRLYLATHLATHLRTLVKSTHNHTASAGISTSKTLAKLAGTINKPDAQTVLHPTTTQAFLDKFEIGKIPGIGRKAATIIRQLVNPLIEPEEQLHEEWFEDVKQKVTVLEVRTKLTQVDLARSPLGGTEAAKVWAWIHGLDDQGVGAKKTVPSQITVEDTFRSLTRAEAVMEVLDRLHSKMLSRMSSELVEDPEAAGGVGKKRWIAVPKTYRLSIRTRKHGFGNRVSRSMPLPSWVLSGVINGDNEGTVGRLSREMGWNLMKRALKEEGEERGWDLQLVNVGVAGIEGAEGGRRTIGEFFGGKGKQTVREEVAEVEEMDGEWELWEEECYVDGEEDEDVWGVCSVCGGRMLRFTLEAHARFHALEHSEGMDMDMA